MALGVGPRGRALGFDPKHSQALRRKLEPLAGHPKLLLHGNAEPADAFGDAHLGELASPATSDVGVQPERNLAAQQEPTGVFIVHTTGTDTLERVQRRLLAGDADPTAPQYLASVVAEFRTVLPGLAVRMASAAVEGLLGDPDILLVEEDAVVWGIEEAIVGDTPVDEPSAAEFEVNPSDTGDATELPRGGGAVLGAAVVTQTSAPWNLDRIDQINRPLSTTYSYENDGTGVDSKCSSVCFNSSRVSVVRGCRVCCLIIAV